MPAIEPLLSQLQRYTPFDATEAAHVGHTIAFLTQTARPFNRETLQGHVTGSAIVVDSTYQHMLLLHHRKLDRWLQPGGHCDGNPDSLAVARQEVQEETGLLSATPVSDQIFDVDVHQIPLKGAIPEHWHYDIRYLFIADLEEAFQQSEQEVIALKWVPLGYLDQIAPDASLYRVRNKLKIQQTV